MRRVLVVALGMSTLLGLTATPALAQAPTPGPGQSEVAAASANTSGAKPVCTVNDPAVVEVSGLIALQSGYVAINDSNTDASAIKIFYLDGGCKLTRSVSYPNAARDPEDLALGPNGELWVADIGDNIEADSRRQTIAIWTLPQTGNQRPAIHRLTYPDGPHDAEAMLVTASGAVVIVTKNLVGASDVYVIDKLPAANNATGAPLRKVGQVKTLTSDTPLGLVASRTSVTGAARSPDGKRVVLRTYADAYEWDVPNGDIVKAITTGEPRRTALPSEPQGEAISYSPDGASFLTISDVGRGGAPLLRYAPTAAPSAAPPAGGGSAAPDDGRSWLSTLSLQQLSYVVAGVGALGALFVLVGVLGITRSRRTRRAAFRAAGGSDGAGQWSPGGRSVASSRSSGPPMAGPPRSGPPMAGPPRSGPARSGPPMAGPQAAPAGVARVPTGGPTGSARPAGGTVYGRPPSSDQPGDPPDFRSGGAPRRPGP